MQRNGWVKYFADGTKEDGYDDLIQSQQASWSKGRLDNIVKVTLVNSGAAIGITGIGEFWQSDTFEARILVNEGKLVERTLYKRIIPSDKFFTYVPEDSMVYVTTRQVNKNSRPISSKQVGKWIIGRMESYQIFYTIGDR